MVKAVITNAALDDLLQIGRVIQLAIRDVPKRLCLKYMTDASAWEQCRGLFRFCRIGKSKA